jgi:hypothetical protein
MPANYVLLEKITVGAAGASSVTFSGIPQTGYTDLVVKISARNDASNVAGGVWLYPNGSSANMTGRILAGTGSVAVSGTDTKVYGYTNSANSTASTFGNIEFLIPNYTSSNYKSISVDAVMENNATEGRQGLMAGLWSITSAITSLEFQTFNNSTSAAANFVSGSTFYLYGVAKLGTTPAIVPYATGGDTIMTDGTYWYHAFKASGTFTPAKALSCDVLVVAGGGGGGANVATVGGGGAGAGGVLAFTAQSLSTSAQTVTVGAGGAAAANGSNSIFGSLTTCVGGGKGGDGAVAGSTGGSGGGGGGSASGGAATSSQGFAGGTGAGNQGGGGGGGGAVGGNATGGTGPAGNGGIGLNTWSSWLSTTGLGVSGYIAGGGGGGGNSGTTTAAGTGGSGGGAPGSYAFPPAAATSNTGGGGGGGGYFSLTSYSGSAGGSGLVIVRYAV